MFVLHSIHPTSRSSTIYWHAEQKKNLYFCVFSFCLIRWLLVPRLLWKFCIFIALDIFTTLPFRSSLLQKERHYVFKLLYSNRLWLFLFPLSRPLKLSWHCCWFGQSQWQLIDRQFHIWILPNLLREPHLLLLICPGTDSRSNLWPSTLWVCTNSFCVKNSPSVKDSHLIDSGNQCK